MAQTLDFNSSISQYVPLVVPQCDVDVDNIQRLDDEPNDVGGLSAQELKEKFDETGKDLKSYINDDLIPTLIAADATEQARAAAEAERVANEIKRVSNENTRVGNETARGSAETARANAESARNIAESGRVAAESGRASAESIRVSNESSRGQAETGRVNAEASRVSAENTRQGNEATRGQQETARQTNESGRVTAEGLRVIAESGRVTAENARKVFENYNNSKAYVIGNKVAYNGSSYYCIANTTGHLPTDTTYWLLMAAKGQDGQGTGDMDKSIYDTQNKATDIFAYADAGLAKKVNKDINSNIAFAIGVDTNGLYFKFQED